MPKMSYQTLSRGFLSSVGGAAPQVLRPSRTGGACRIGYHCRWDALPCRMGYRATRCAAGEWGMQIVCATGSSTAGLLWCMARAAAGSRVPNPRHRTRPRTRTRTRMSTPSRQARTREGSARLRCSPRTSAHCKRALAQRDAERRSTRERADQAGRSSRIPNTVRPSVRTWGSSTSRCATRSRR